MFLFLLAIFLLLLFAAIALVAGIGIVAILAAIVVGATLLGALAAITIIFASRHADAVRRNSSRAQVLSDIQALESRLVGNDRA